MSDGRFLTLADPTFVVLWFCPILKLTENGQTSNVVHGPAANDEPVVQRIKANLNINKLTTEGSSRCHDSDRQSLF